MVHLAEGLPGSKWHAARAAMSADLPIVPLLGKSCFHGQSSVVIKYYIVYWGILVKIWHMHMAGYFWGSQSNAGASVSAEEEKVLWLVCFM